MKKYNLIILLLLIEVGLNAQVRENNRADPEIDYTKPEATEVWLPVPRKVVPGTNYLAPSDAIILFDGKGLNEWRKPQFIREQATLDGVMQQYTAIDDNWVYIDADWIVKDNFFQVKPGAGAIETKKSFGDVQLHIEWLSPVDKGKKGQQYSNSGIFFMGLYELQVLNSYENQTYANGQASSIYKQYMPTVNVSKPPGEWQSYDVVFIAPKFDENGELKTPAVITVFHNGVLVHHAKEISGPTLYIGKPSYFRHKEKLPLRLQDHGDSVRFRNIWIREI